MAKLSVFQPSSIEQSHGRRHPIKNLKNFTNKSCYAKKNFILKIFFRGRGVPPSVSRRLLISPDFPLRFLRGPN